MSLANDPTPGLDDCGCCDGLGMQAPQVIGNRPGLSATAYRIGTHSQFKATMLARLSAADLPALRDLTTRADGDFTIALLDAWAAVGDVLTFYQERIANEGYLRTATERRSLVALANLIGYLPRPGVAASAHLAFTVDDTGAPGEVAIPAGTRVQSIPGPDEKPQVFETIEAIAAHPEWNAMRPQLLQKHPDLTPDTRTVTLRGDAVNLGAGDSLLLLCGAGAANQVVKRVLAVTVDRTAGTTRIDLDEDPPDPPPLLIPVLPVAVWNPAPLKLTSAAVSGNVMSGSWRQADLHAFARVQAWPLPKLAANIAVLAFALRQFVRPETGVFALRQRAAIFGHNAPNYTTLPAVQRLTDYVTGPDGKLVAVSPPYPTDWEKRTLSQEPGGPTDEIDLDNTYPTVVSGSWLVLEDQARRNVYRVTGVSELSRADFTLTSKVSRVKLDAATDFASYKLRTTTVLAQSEKLELAELPVTDVVRGNRLLLDRTYLGLTVGRPVVVSGLRTDLAGVTDSEVQVLADVRFVLGQTELVFMGELAHEYERASVTVNANVALATHGETKDAALGGGDGNTTFQRFDLPESPLTYVAAANPKGAASTLAVRVNGVLWQEVDFLHNRGPDEHIYLTRTRDDGRTYVEFGDGQTGARLPTGQENVRATYRKGMGTDGLVGEGQLSLLLSKPLGVRAVVNPVAAADAADPESRDDLRQSAALPTRALDRVVSLRDHEDFARAFTGVAKALTTWTWDGHHQGVFVTVAGPDSAAIGPGSRVYQNLIAAMLNAGDGTVPLRVGSYRPAFFRLAGKVSVNRAYQSDQVLAGIESALRGAFGFDARELGQPVVKSEVITTIQAVPGVLAVDLDELHRVDATDEEVADFPLLERLPAQVPRAGTDVKLAAELLLLDPRPVELGVMGT